MMKLSPEREFLPAALEIERTPPLPLSRWILWSIMLFFLIAVIWATFGKVDIVGVAQGKIVPSGRVKVVQPFGTGVVRAIHIEEGQRVAAGDVLIELDDTKARADLERLLEEQTHLAWNKSRLDALLARLHEPAGWRPRNDLPAAVLARIEQEYLALVSQQQGLVDELRSNRGEHATVIAQIEQIDATLPFLTERAAAVQKLEKQSLAPRVGWLELEEERIDQARERDVLRTRLVVSDSQHNTIEQRLATLVAQTEAQWRSELADVETRLAGYTQEIRKAETRVAEHRLTASVDGTVQQLTINTVGGVVTPAEKLMLIVPDEGAVHVEAWLANKDVGFVQDGQEAEIKVETFPFTKYGTIAGAIKTVSSDAVPNDDLGLVYMAQVTMAETTMWVRDKLVNLTPGMAVTVEVNMGKRRVIEFLLTPLLRYRDEGLTER